MTRTTNARIAGVTFLLYIVTGMSSMALNGWAASGATDVAAKLAAIAAHPSLTRINVLVSLLSAGYALVLGVTLYSLTRDQDPDVAITALFCRAGEGLVSAISCVTRLALVLLAAAPGKDAAGQTLAGVLLIVPSWTTLIAATCFAVGSTLFSYLFLRARSIPVVLAWLGVFASILLFPLLPLQLVGWLHGPVLSLMWLPMLVFEVWLALWLIIKGVAAPQTKIAAASSH